MKNKFILKFTALVLILLLTLPLLFTSAENSKKFSLTDYYDDRVYNIEITSDTVNISSDNLNESFKNSINLYDCCVYKGVITFIGYTPIYESTKMQPAFFIYDTRENTQSIFALSNSYIGTPQSFAADKFGSVYIIPSENNSLLQSYSKSGLRFSVSLPARALQLLCLDGENITILTTDGIYLLVENEAILINENPTQTPCYYIGGGIIKDSSLEEYTYEEGKLIKIEPPTETETPSEVEETTNASEENTLEIIENGKYLIIPRGTTVSKLRKALGIKTGEFTVTKTNGKKVTSGKLGTGMKLEYNGLTKYAVIVGDLTAEGNINSRDFKLVMKLITGEEAITEILAVAADLDSNGIINTKDLWLLSRLY